MDASRLTALRSEMGKRGIDIYIIPTSDFHNSEYVGDYFKARKYICGFSGSAGTAVVTKDKAGLWTDGRYFIQAAAELEGSGFELYKMAVEGVPKIEEFLEQELPENGVLGFDGRVVNATEAEKYEKIAKKKNGTLYVTEDLVDMIWTDRPPMACTPLWILTEEYSGESTESKLRRIREKMAENEADYHLISSLYDNAWILNLRADDIKNVPVFLSFLLIGKEDATLFVQEEALNEEVHGYLKLCGVNVRPYLDVYQVVKDLPECALLMDKSQVNYRIVSSLPEHVRVVAKENPSELMKAIKNETELRNTRMAHLKDGVAMTKFMYWLKTNVGKIPMNEYMVGQHADRLRAEQENFLDLSFEDICAYGPNAAMMHYEARDEESAAEVKPEGMLLLDSGGHYLEGTTDITRTFILGPITPKMKLHFTTVLRCNMALSRLKFLYGCGGISMDVVCREPLWEMGIDYRCGTGHGVGHILNVHEGPNGFRYKIVPERKDSGVLEVGMITTDEPGVYLEGEYGIRIENELICVKDEKNEYGQFLKFENITYCPIDLDGVDPGLLSDREKQQLNEYHKNVYEKVSPYLTDDEREWLKTYTRAI